MSYNFTTEEQVKILDHFGEAFYCKVKGLLEELQLKWGIRNLELIPSFSVNMVFKGISENHGPIVLKFSTNHKEFISEVKALKYFEGRNVCSLFEVDFENDVLMEELIEPGDELVKEKTIDGRLDIFCQLFQQLHDKPMVDKISEDINNEYTYKSYQDWIFRITDYMEQQDTWKEVSIHMNRGKEMFVSLSQEFSAKTLLHGDFHYYNILKDKKGYKIIDPKGVIGHPIFDIPRYVLNEFWDEKDRQQVDDKIDTVFDLLNQKLKVSKDVLSQLLYIEGVMSICWNVEDGANISEKVEYLETLETLYGYVLKYGQE